MGTVTPWPVAVEAGVRYGAFGVVTREMAKRVRSSKGLTEVMGARLRGRMEGSFANLGRFW